MIRVLHSVSLTNTILYLVLILTNRSESRAAVNSTVNEAKSEGSVVRLLTILPYPAQPNDSDSLQPYWDGGPAVLPAAQLAVEHINEDPYTLPGYRVELVNVDGGCNIFSKALMNFAENVLYGPPIAGIVGPGCAPSSLAISAILGRPETALPNIHFATSPSLGDRKKYGNTYGIVGSSFNLIQTAISLMEHNKWDKVAALFDSDTFIHLNQKLRNVITNELGKNRVVFLSVVYDTYFPIDSLMNSSARIILLYASPSRALKLLCIGNKKGMVFPYYQWVVSNHHIFELIEAQKDTVFHYEGTFYNCSNEPILQNILLLVFRFKNSDTDTHIVSGYTYLDIRQQYLQKLSENNTLSITPNIRAAITYDAVWALVMAINTSVATFKDSINISSFQFGNKVFIDEIKRNLDKLKFASTSGFIDFDTTSGYTHRTVDIIHINNSMETNLVGFINRGNISILTDDPQIFIDTTVTSKTEVVHPSVAVIFLLVILSLSTVTFLLHILSTVKRKHPSIKASSPLLNHFIFFGCYALITLSIIYIIVLKSLSFEDEHTYANSCHAVFAWLLPIGWTLIFGTLITKTWRIYRIFIHFRDPGRLISNQVLSALVILQLGFDIAIGAVWSVLSPAQLQKTNKPIISGQHNTMTMTYLMQRSCVFADYNGISPLFWIVAVCVYKALQVIVLLMLTLLTRNITNLKFSTFLLRKASYFSFFLFVSLLQAFIILWYNDAEIHIDFILLCTFISGTIFTCFTFVLLPPALPVLKKLCV